MTARKRIARCLICGDERKPGKSYCEGNCYTLAQENSHRRYESSYVYFILKKSNCELYYIGETENILDRRNDHRSGKTVISDFCRGKKVNFDDEFEMMVLELKVEDRIAEQSFAQRLQAYWIYQFTGKVKSLKGSTEGKEFSDEEIEEFRSVEDLLKQNELEFVLAEELIKRKRNINPLTYINLQRLRRKEAGLEEYFKEMDAPIDFDQLSKKIEALNLKNKYFQTYNIKKHENMVKI